MRLRTAMIASALALAPLLALADPPMLVRIDGHVVPAQQTTRIVQTAAGPARVSTWRWHAPDGQAGFVVQTSSGGAPPLWALREMQAMQTRMQLMQMQMQQLQQAALHPAPGLPAPLAVLFAAPVWEPDGAPRVVTVVEPASRAATPTTPTVTAPTSPTPAQAPAARAPGLKV